MAPLHESPSHEAAALRSCLNDIVGITALPALWTGAGPERIAGTLLDALGEVLGASFVYARLDGFAGAPAMEFTWVGEPLWGGVSAHEIGASIERALGPTPSRWSGDSPVELRGTAMCLSCARLGLQGEVGMIVAGCRRDGFPRQTERVLLDVAANQAAVALQQARLREEQERLARSLDERVAERTRELAAACEELRSAAAERERARVDRDMAANNLTRFLDTFPGYVVTLSPDGRVEHLNQEVLAYFGKTPEELRDWSLTDAVPPDELPWVVETVGRSFAAGEPYTIEHRCRRADGVYRWFEIRSHPVRDGDGRLTGWYVLLTDIDERKRVEDALRERERETRLIVDSIPGLIAVFSARGECEFINRQGLEYFGRTLDDLKDWGAGDFVHPDHLPRAVEAFARAVETGEPFDIISRARRADGTYRWLQSRGYPLRDSTGAIVRWYNLMTDVDEWKRVEQALRDRERDARQIVDSIPGMIAVFSGAGTVEFVNQTTLDFYGIPLEEHQRWETGEHVHPEDLPSAIEAFAHAVATGEPFEMEVRARRADGAYRWVHSRGSPLRDSDGQVVRWFNLLTDIDERKRAEDALRERERESRLIVDSIPGLIAVFSEHGEAEFVNQPTLDYFGRSRDDLDGWTTGDQTHPEDLARAVALFTHSLATGDPFEVEVRIRDPQGAYRWIQSRASPLRDSTGRIVRWYCLMTDIDERKRAEEALAASGRNLKLTIDTIPALAWSTGPGGGADFFNQHYLDYIGLSSEQLAGWGWTAALHPDDLNGLTTAWQERVASGEPLEAEARLRRHDGAYRWFLLRASPLRDESGCIVKWYGVNADIEDRKQSEDALRRSEAFLLDIQRLSRFGTWRFNVATGVLEHSAETHRAYGVQPGDDVASAAFWFGRIHPDDRSRVQAEFERCAREGEPYQAAYRIVLPDGRVGYSHSSGHPIVNEAGETEFYGAVIDMTAEWETANELERASEALRELQAKMSQAAQVATMGEFAASVAHEVNQPLAGIITNASTCLRMLGTDPPSLEGAGETVRRILRDGNRAAEVVTRLRALFSKKELAMEPMDLNAAILEVVALLSADLQKQGVTFRPELARGLPSVAGDQVQIQQVIHNLILNAAEAMAGVGDRPRSLLIRTERGEGDCVRTIVQDSGVGIDPSVAGTLFDAFNTTKSRGMGIGLSVSRSIVERHSGRIWVERNEGPGSTFVFTLPCRPEEHEDRSDARDRGSPHSNARSGRR